MTPSLLRSFRSFSMPEESIPLIVTDPQTASLADDLLVRSLANIQPSLMQQWDRLLRRRRQDPTCLFSWIRRGHLPLPISFLAFGQLHA